MSPKTSTDADLANFIRSAKDHGVNDDFIVSLLRQNGWSERRIFRTFSACYADTLGTPVPVRVQHVENAREAFYYLLNFITLGFWSVALGQLFYILIAHRFPDAIGIDEFPGSLRDQIAWQAATVVVAFPIFLFVHSAIQRELARRPDLYESGVRKWLTYLALVIAAIIVIGDAVWFVEALIRGEITTRFMLDSLVLLVLGGGIFGYYISTINPPAQEG
jgi:hypothetical protein